MNGLMEPCAKKEKEKSNSQGKDPRTFDVNSQGGDLGTSQKQTARVRTQELSKNQSKGGESRRSGRKRSGRKRRRKRMRKNEVQKKQLVEKGERKDCKLACGEV